MSGYEYSSCWSLTKSGASYTPAQSYLVAPDAISESMDLVTDQVPLAAQQVITWMLRGAWLCPAVMSNLRGLDSATCARFLPTLPDSTPYDFRMVKGGSTTVYTYMSEQPAEVSERRLMSGHATWTAYQVSLEGAFALAGGLGLSMLTLLF